MLEPSRVSENSDTDLHRFPYELCVKPLGKESSDGI
jgi:hypothetical protein